MENNKKLGQEPAFPIEYSEYNKSGVLCKRQEFGMSKRFYAACLIMQGLCVGMTKSRIKEYVKRSYIIADELLKQE
jgi:hypothetical protein